MARLNSPEDLEKLRQEVLSRNDPKRPCISICAGTGCIACGAAGVVSAFEEDLRRQGLGDKADVKRTGCHGFCEQGPAVVVHPDGVFYARVKPEDVPEIVSRTIKEKKVVERLLYVDPATGQRVVHESEIQFFEKQKRLVLGSNSRIDPGSIEDYLAVGGYSALVKVLRTMSPEKVISDIKESGLRGRSGSGFPAGRKWEACRNAEGETKYVICNCHEGDPGAFVDRMMMEANPHLVLEGMIIGAYSMAAHDGYIFVGGEFPLTVENVGIAIRQAEEHGLLGQNILGSGFDFTVRLSIDGGSYVCGESTALMASMDGRVGEPIRKYDHATERGLRARPTVLNNLQTWANVPLIINQGVERYRSIGTSGSKGTKVFSLTGAVVNTGMVEVPMGATLKEIVFDIGGGVRGGGKFKALQVGGPLGGFVPENQLNLKVDFDELGKAGLSMGPSLVVMDENACIVDTVKYFVTFLSDESCGKCTPCREVFRQILKVLNRISGGRGREGDIELLKELSDVQRDATLCALGQGAPSPIDSALAHFRDEFEAHIGEKRCPAGVCRGLSAAGPR
ncbi:MAG: NAD(P)H-dependent oxidoreductase subunit E [Deltaproteobacteria bacterium]|nr:NAD(P)H-dependent oxidoreductase subunit E [Deltaproteobacteria bacterium]